MGKGLGVACRVGWEFDSSYCSGHVSIFSMLVWEIVKRGLGIAQLPGPWNWKSDMYMYHTFFSFILISECMLESLGCKGVSGPGLRSCLITVSGFAKRYTLEDFLMQIVHVEEIGARRANYVELPHGLSEISKSALKRMGVDRMYSHQVLMSS